MSAKPPRQDKLRNHMHMSSWNTFVRLWDVLYGNNIWIWFECTVKVLEIHFSFTHIRLLYSRLENVLDGNISDHLKGLLKWLISVVGFKLVMKYLKLCSYTLQSHYFFIWFCSQCKKRKKLYQEMYFLRYVGHSFVYISQIASNANVIYLLAYI